MWFRMWAWYFVEWLNIRLMECWQYVCDIPQHKLLKFDENEWTPLQSVSPSPMFEQIRTTYKKGWTPLQVVSPSPMFEQFRTIDKNGWTPLQRVSPSPMFEQFRTIDKDGWTPLQLVSPSPIMFEQIRTIDNNGWTPLQDVSPSPTGMFEQIRTTDKNGSLACFTQTVISLAGSQCSTIDWFSSRPMIWQSF